jgi:hypothetical protein
MQREEHVDIVQGNCWWQFAAAYRMPLAAAYRLSLIAYRMPLAAAYRLSLIAFRMPLAAAYRLSFTTCHLLPLTRRIREASLSVSRGQA